MPELRRGRWTWHLDAGPLYLAICRGRLTRFVEVRVGWRGRMRTWALGGGWPEVVGWALGAVICVVIPLALGYWREVIAGTGALAVLWVILSPIRR